MEKRTYGYARVSTKEQNLSRQIEQLKAEGIPEDRIISDKQSGKDFERYGYGYLTNALLREGDLLIITSIDRLGRNYDEIRQQWQRITKEIKADIKVLDMPLLDTTAQQDSLDSSFIADLVLQILAYVADKELQANRRRREEGVKVMPIGEDGKRVSLKTGRPCGRPAAQFPDRWKQVIARHDKGELTAVAAMKELGLTKATFYRLLKAYRQADGDMTAAKKVRGKTLAAQRNKRKN